jgi:NTP pyrophosphatase (non-canonical NTP hydrolase)
MMGRNEDRAARFAAVLHHYQSLVGEDYKEDLGDCLADLMSEAQHFAFSKGISFEKTLYKSQYIFGYERRSPESMEPAPSQVAGV